MVDISEIRDRELLLEEAIEEAETARRDIESIIASIDIGLIVLDRDFNIQLMNEAYRKMIAVPGEELPDFTGRTFRDLLYENFIRGRHPGTETSFDAYYERRVADVRAGRVEPRETRTRNGLAILYSVIPLSAGRSLLCFVDLTELRQRDTQIAVAHEDVEKALQLVRTATDMMPEGLMVLEGEHVVFANGSLAKLFNVPERLIVTGARWEDLYRATALQNRAISQSEIDDGVERFRNALLQRKDVAYDFPLGQERWIHLKMRGCANGQTVVICSDETTVVRREAELKRLVARAEAADRAKSEFLANIGLEIRTPMNAILGMAELLSKSHLDTRQKAFTDIIVKSGKTLLTLINDVLDISKLDAGNLELKYSAFDPVEAVDDVLSLLAFRAVEKDLELIARHAKGMPRLIMGDAARFRQIVFNLLSNAVKFTERGHVIVTTGVVSDGVGQAILGVSVEDTGIGIPTEMLASIFEKFLQVERPGGGRREGTGLGLSIAQRLAHLQGGTISVHSTEHRGSTFTLSLPVKVVEDQARAKPAPANVAGARVLVADDHDAAREYLTDLVSHWGFECVGAADHSMALSILEAAADSGVPVDVMLVDGHLPDIAGVPLAERIRANPRFMTLSVVTMVSRGPDEIGDLADDPNVQAQILKPVRAPLLKDILIEVIRAARQQQQSANVVPIQPTTKPATEPGLSTDEPPAVFHSLQPLLPRSYILVAEDNEVNGIFFSQILEAAGFDFTLVRDGLQAVETWLHERPLAILMDTSMPLMDGFEATRRIRAAEESLGGHTPILGVLGNVHHGEPGLCASAGMDDHITKPVSPERLEEKLREWLDGQLLVFPARGDRS